MEVISLVLGILLGVIGVLGSHCMTRNPSLEKKPDEPGQVESEVIFFPDLGLQDLNLSKAARGMQYKSILSSSVPLKRLLHHLTSAKVSIDVCMFMITSHDLTDAIVNKIKSGVKVRLIVDRSNEYIDGSTVTKFLKKGAFFRSKPMPYLMHHKFAIVDGEKLVNGSFNWTMQAVMGNEENVIVTNDKFIVSKFVQKFDSLWQKLSL